MTVENSSKKIIMKPKKYRGHESALDYFYAHLGKYGGINRDILNQTDSGLYRRLNQEGTLGCAINFKLKSTEGGRKHLREEEKERIVRIAEICNYNVTKTAEKSGYAVGTVSRCLEQRGLRPKIKRGNPLSKSKKRAIEILYDVWNGNASDVAREAGCATSTAIKYLRSKGYKINPQGTRGSSQ